MSTENAITIGKIIYINDDRTNGVIDAEDGRDFFFEINNVMTGTARLGESVQFRAFKDDVFGDVAKEIVVLSDAARMAK